MQYPPLTRLTKTGFQLRTRMRIRKILPRHLRRYARNIVRIHQDIDLNIYGDCISDSERPVYEEAIKNYYSLKFTEAARTVTRKGFISLIFTIIGVVTLSLMFVLSELGAGAVWTECVDIFAWVFLWEAVDQFFIERKGVLLKMKRYYAFMNSRITFISSPKE